MSLIDIIPEEFYKGDEKPYAETVAELIDELKLLPPDLPVKHGLADGCKLVVYNITSAAFLEVIDSDF